MALRLDDPSPDVFPYSVASSLDSFSE